MSAPCPADVALPDGEYRRARRAELRDELRADVAVMRELGVSEWGEIKLGAPAREATPVRVLSVEEQKALVAAREQERLDILFGASGVRPR